MDKIKLQVEDLEERIAPSICIDPTAVGGSAMGANEVPQVAVDPSNPGPIGGPGHSAVNMGGNAVVTAVPEDCP